MSDQEPMSSLDPQAPHEEPAEKRPSRRRYLRHILWTGTGITIVLLVSIVGLFFWASSANFENMVRKRLVARIGSATGGRVEITSFHWNLLSLEAEVGGIVIHGLEAPGEAPYAQVDSLRVQVNVLGVLSPRILLRDLAIVRPRLHLIVYPDGSTNQPQPRVQASTTGHPLDTFFDLQASRVVVEQGVLDDDNRAADFDFQSRRIPLDFSANEVSLRLSYVPVNLQNPESYHVEASARNLHLMRGAVSHLAASPVDGNVQATLDLTRNAVYLRSLRLTASSKGSTDYVLNIAGQLTNFDRPRWQATVKGDVDLRLMEPITGYAFTPEGIASLDMAAQGYAGQFRADGTVHAENASYVGPGVTARGVGLDARIHADPERLLITSVVARLRQGGQLEGDVLLDHWVAPIPGTPEMRAATPPVKRSNGSKVKPKTETVQTTSAPVSPDLHTNGKVDAVLKNVSLDTILDIVGQAPFQRLGLDARFNGLAAAVWTNGDVRTLSVTSKLNVNSSGKSLPDEVPVTGAIDATYTQRDGGVDVRRLEIKLPASNLQAHGHLGRIPTQQSHRHLRGL